MNNIEKIFLCFNDESGSIDDKKLIFYVRVSLVLNAKDLKKIENHITEIRREYNLLNLKEEIKWQDLWLVRNYFKNKNHTKSNVIGNYLESINKDYKLLIDYCDNILSSVLKNFESKIFITFTELDKVDKYKKENIYKFHIQDHLQRIQMQYNENCTLIVVYDNLRTEQQKLFKSIYKEIILKGDFVKYKSFSETLLFDNSYDNKILQLTDFIAGTFRNVLIRIYKNDKKNYEKAIYFFKHYIFNNLALDNNQNFWGVGIKETPKNNKIRNIYLSKIQELLK